MFSRLFWFFSVQFGSVGFVLVRDGSLEKIEPSRAMIKARGHSLDLLIVAVTRGKFGRLAGIGHAQLAWNQIHNEPGVRMKASRLLGLFFDFQLHELTHTVTWLSN